VPATKTYPTPAADQLAQAKPLLEAQIRAYQLGRTRHWEDASFTRTRLREAIAAVGLPMPAQSTTIKGLVSTLVHWDMTKSPDRHPVIARLAALERRAAEESYILDGVTGHVVEEVDAKFRDLLRVGSGPLASPLLAAQTGMQWQEDRATAHAWAFIGKQIGKGKTPHQAAVEAVKYFTAQVIQAARRGDWPRGGIEVAIEARNQAAYAKFLDKLTILDGLVSPEEF
jgi:hypothetical protein